MHFACHTRLKNSLARIRSISNDSEALRVYVPEINERNRSAGTEKELALFFLDIRNFTSFMETRSAHDVVQMIRKLFTLFNRSIKESGGKVIETAGDSIYAVFGLNQTIEDAVSSAVSASYNILSDLKVFNETYAGPYFDLNFEIGIGLHAGKVIIGEFDIEGNEHLTVMGLPVNIASRLQSATKELNNNFIISDEAYSYLKKPVSQGLQKTVRLRGVSRHIDVRLLGQPYEGYKPGLSMIVA